MSKKRSILCLGLRAIIFFLPVLPLFLFLSIVNSAWAEPLFWFTLICFLIPLPLQLAGKLSRFEKLLNGLQILSCGVLLLFFARYWFLIFPELMWAVLFFLFILGVFSSLKPLWADSEYPKVVLTTLLPPVLFLCTMAAVYKLPLKYMGLYSVCISCVIAITLCLRRRESLGLPVWIPIIVLSAYGTVLCLVHHVYTCDQTALASEIADQDGIQNVSPSSYLLPGQLLGESVKQGENYPEIPFHDISCFFVHKDNLILLPRHLSQVTCLRKRQKPLLFKTGGDVADNIVFDPVRPYFYFVSGRNLYRGSLKTMSLKLMHKFGTNLTNSSPGPNYIHGNPGTDLKRLLIQFDLDDGVFIYDLKEKREQRIRSKYTLIESIWHPDGTKIIAYGIDTTSIRGHFILMDLQGNIVSHRSVIPFDDISLTPAVSDEFFAAFFHEGRVERLSVNTLKASWVLDVDTTPRAVTESEQHGCVLVPSYAKGTLSVYRADNKVLLCKLLIGKRVRAVTPALKENGYWISSSAGLFFVNLAEILEGVEKNELYSDQNN